MTTSSFEYFAPTTLAEAQSLLSTHGGDAKVVAGGHSLIPMMKLRLAEPKYLIDLDAYRTCLHQRARRWPGHRRHDQLLRDRDLACGEEQFLALSEAASLVADLQVRNKGTIGGSLSHSDRLRTCRQRSWPWRGI